MASVRILFDNLIFYYSLKKINILEKYIFYFYTESWNDFSLLLCYASWALEGSPSTAGLNYSSRY